MKIQDLFTFHGRVGRATYALTGHHRRTHKTQHRSRTCPANVPTEMGAGELYDSPGRIQSDQPAYRRREEISPSHGTGCTAFHLGGHRHDGEAAARCRRGKPVRQFCSLSPP